MSVFPLNIEDKEDHPETLAKREGVDPKFYIKAEDFNTLKEAARELKDNPTPGPEGPRGQDGGSEGVVWKATLAEVNAIDPKNTEVAYGVYTGATGYYYWDGSSATVDFNRELGIKKSDLEEVENQSLGSEEDLNDGLGILIPNIGEVVTYDTAAITGANTIVDVLAGDEFILSGRGFNSPRLYAFVDENDVVLSKSDSNQVSLNLRVKASQDGKLIYNTSYSEPYSLRKVAGFFEEAKENFEDYKALKDETYGNEFILDDDGVVTPSEGSIFENEIVDTPGFHTIVDVIKGERYILSGRGFNTLRLYALLDSNDVILERADSNVTLQDLIIDVRQDGKLIFNTYPEETTGFKPFISKIGEFFKDTRSNISTLQTDVNDVQDNFIIDRKYSSFAIDEVFVPNVTIAGRPELVDAPESSASIHAKYDALAAAHPNYITKTFLGNEATGLPINLYEFKPVQLITDNFQRKRQKVIIATGTHGYEPIPTVTVLSALENIANNWEDNKLLEWLRFNVDFIVVPCVSPYSIDNDQRKNSNGVDINRNFPGGWLLGDDINAETYGGPSPLSELEAQYFQQVMEDNAGATLLLDYHNFLNSSGTEVTNERVIWTLPVDERSARVCDGFTYRMLSTLAKQYDYITPDSQISRMSKSFAGLIASQAYLHDIPLSLTFETTDRMGKDENGSKYDSTVLTVAYQAFINFILKACSEVV